MYPTMTAPMAGDMDPAQQAAAAANRKKEAPKKPRRKVLTSLIMQILIVGGGLWFFFYYVMNIITFVYKGVVFPYPTQNFAMEFCFAWLWVFVEIPRVVLLSHGNKVERGWPIWWSWWLSLPIIGMYVYFVRFQTYTLKFDQILNTGSLVVIALQSAWSLVIWLRFIFSTRFAP